MIKVIYMTTSSAPAAAPDAALPVEAITLTQVDPRIIEVGGRRYRLTIKAEDLKNRSDDPANWKEIPMNEAQRMDVIARATQQFIERLQANGQGINGKFSVTFTRAQQEKGYLWWKHVEWKVEDLKFKAQGKTVTIDVEAWGEQDQAIAKTFTDTLNNSNIPLNMSASQAQAKPQAVLPRHARRIVEGTRNQFQGTDRNACTAIAATFLQQTLTGEAPQAGAWIDQQINTGKTCYRTAAPLARPGVPNPLLSFAEANNPPLAGIAVIPDPLPPADGLDGTRNGNVSVEGFRERLEEMANVQDQGDRNFPVGAVLTLQGGSYALQVNRTADGAVENVIFFDSHGERGTTPAYFLEFTNIDEAATFLAEKFNPDNSPRTGLAANAFEITYLRAT